MKYALVRSLFEINHFFPLIQICVVFEQAVLLLAAISNAQYYAYEDYGSEYPIEDGPKWSNDWYTAPQIYRHGRGGKKGYGSLGGGGKLCFCLHFLFHLLKVNFVQNLMELFFIYRLGRLGRYGPCSIYIYIYLYS